MIEKNLKISLIILIISISFKSFGQRFSYSNVSWKVESDHNNIKIFEAITKHKSGLVPLKVQTTINHPISRVISVMTDASRKKEWVPRLLEAKTIESIKFGEYIDYVRFDGPWPVSDRDFLIYIKCSFNAEKKEVFAEIYSVTHPKVPLIDGFIRAHTYNGNSYLKSIENDTKTYVELSFLTDYKGNIPKWIINLIQLKWPRDFIGHLNKQLSKDNIVDKYKHFLKKITPNK